jgi:DNA repair exonuclease SbcCD ATPase subunit
MANRKEIVFAAGALLIFGGAIAFATPQSQSQTSSQSATQTSAQQSQDQSGVMSAPPAAEQQMSLGDAARKNREQNKSAHPAKTFTNDDLPKLRGDGLSTVGPEPAAPAAGADSTAATAKPEDAAKGEQYWRKRFADLRTKIADTQKEIDVLQRELNLAQREYYPDPNVALQQQHSREDINAKTEKIDEKKKQLGDLQQQLSNLQDELRRAGGDPDWGR